MANATIKLGANKSPLGNPIRVGHLRGFFYGGGSGTHSRNASRNPDKQRTPARQHLILQTICRQVVSTVRVWTGSDRLVHPDLLPAPFI